MYNCIIVDDEFHSIEILKSYIETIPDLKLLNSFNDPLKALAELENSVTIDVIFLDINMPKMCGLEFSKKVRSKVKKIVFITGHSKYAYEAFEAESDAFLLKPYSRDKFANMVQRLFPQEARPIAIKKNDFFFIKIKEENLRLVKVIYSEIVTIESKLNHVAVHTLDKSMLTYMTLSEVSTQLADQQNFQQFHRSFIINEQHIEYIEGNTINMVNGTRLSVGDYYRKKFTGFIANNILKTKRKT